MIQFSSDRDLEGLIVPTVKFGLYRGLVIAFNGATIVDLVPVYLIILVECQATIVVGVGRVVMDTFIIRRFDKQEVIDNSSEFLIFWSGDCKVHAFR